MSTIKFKNGSLSEAFTSVFNQDYTTPSYVGYRIEGNAVSYMGFKHGPIEYSVTECSDCLFYTYKKTRKAVKNELKPDSLALWLLTSYLKEVQLDFKLKKQELREEERERKKQLAYWDRHGKPATKEEIHQHFLNRVKELGLEEYHAKISE